MRATIYGRLANKPTIKNENTDKQYCYFTLAQDTSKQGKTNFHNCKAFGKLAGTIYNNFDKGSRIVMEVEYLQNEVDGTRYHELQVNGMQFVDTQAESKVKQQPTTPAQLKETQDRIAQYRKETTPTIEQDGGDLPW